MAIMVQLIVPADAIAMVTIGGLAFEGDPLESEAIRLDIATAEEREDYVEWRVARIMQRLAKPGSHWFKAVDAETGEMVGFSGIYDTRLGQDVTSLNQPSDVNSLPFPKIVNKQMMDEHGKELEEKRVELMGNRADYWYLQSMVVSPLHQRRGIGKLLLQRALAEADAFGQDIYLEAMPAAVKLYLAAGFVVLDTIVPLQRFHQSVMSMMLRKAQSKA